MTVNQVFKVLFILCILGIWGYGLTGGFVIVPEGETCTIGCRAVSFCAAMFAALPAYIGIVFVEWVEGRL